MRCACGRSGVAVVSLASLLACAPEGDVRTGAAGDEPPEDGERVIKYDVEVEEDDTRCNAQVPYKYSTEQMTVEWHTDHDITMYARGGIYQKDLTLDDNGEYTDDGAAGPCLPGSTVWGRITREEGVGTAICKKADCDVHFNTRARRRIAAPDAGVPADGGGMPGG